MAPMKLCAWCQRHLQVDSKYSTEPGWVTGTSERFKSKNASAVRARGGGLLLWPAMHFVGQLHAGMPYICTFPAKKLKYTANHEKACDALHAWGPQGTGFWSVENSQALNCIYVARDQPGVGSYNVNNNALGKQALSQKKTLPSPKIGTGTRDAFKRVSPDMPAGQLCCAWSFIVRASQMFHIAPRLPSPIRVERSP
eukprot:scaffold55058_cov19-Tisochrysis_lutea.AAC.2